MEKWLRLRLCPQLGHRLAPAGALLQASLGLFTSLFQSSQVKRESDSLSGCCVLRCILSGPVAIGIALSLSLSLSCFLSLSLSFALLSIGNNFFSFLSTSGRKRRKNHCLRLLSSLVHPLFLQVARQFFHIYFLSPLPALIQSASLSNPIMHN